MHLLIFGHGYSAGFLTPLLVQEGWTVSGTTRGSSDRVRAAGANPLLWPGDEDGVARAIAQADAILASVAPDGDADPVLAAFGPQIAAAKPSWLGYLSTTGVYGDREGGWVDEDSPLEPATRRGKARVAAEAEWQALADKAALPLHIFRLAGIYGPGRGPFRKLRDGTARRIVKPGQVFSRIHAADIAQAVAASLSGKGGPGIYNLCDDDPAPPQDVIEHAARLLDMPVPPEIAIDDAEMTPMALSFYAESKRVRNDRMKDHLGITLIHPDYRSGLSAILREEEDGAGWTSAAPRA
ncbi:SDR family oxidoreductase (plasmid) [Paracoccus sp. TK19116]|uniref:SDR family oxidoreductase n=1 Tax=Paracoccus albicereus TaxID=2922394 RepID=A0ABT1MLP9_9RHOB|nr:SDR family oxidoreductase [Paracoccus albicereus]MCQ0969200.1 SDR family oxidoreductase [Paracoccus albicereus]